LSQNSGAIGYETQALLCTYPQGGAADIVLVALVADRLTTAHAMPVRISAWHRKTQPTFSDALALSSLGARREVG